MPVTRASLTCLVFEYFGYDDGDTMLCSALDGRDRRKKQLSGLTLKALGPDGQGTGKETSSYLDA